MKTKIKDSTKKLFKSCVDNKVLFERRKNSILVPLIIFILSIFMVCVPPFLSSKNTSSDKIIKGFPGVSEPIKKLLTYPLDCYVKDAKLVCNENAARINETVEIKQTNENGKEILKYTYTIIANQTAIKETNVTYNDPQPTDNLILLLKNYIKIRYIERDHVKEEVITYEIIGDYSEFEGYNFKEISEKLNNNPELIDAEVTNFVHKTYLSTLDTQLKVNIVSSILSFTVFVLVSSVILKGPSLFKRKKGFKFSECIKISLTSSLPALFIGTISYFILGMDFALTYGMVYIIRIVYIYFKYITSAKNSIFKELYETTKEERFNV